MRSFAIAVLLITAFALPAFAETAAKTAAGSASAFTDKQRAQIDAAVKQFIMDNPQVLISSVEAFYNKQNEVKKVQEGPLTQFPAGLLDYPGTPFAGPKDAKTVMVEFFDYNCGYCKQVATDVERIIADEKNLKFIFKELPILSDTSEVAARYALAANAQGKYQAYHNALMEHQGPISEALLTETAKSVGLDVDKLKKDANTQEVRDQLAKNVDLARELGVRGTPFFVIGKQKVPGAVGYSKMKEMIATERGDIPAAAATTSSATETAPSATADTETTTTPADTSTTAAANAVTADKASDAAPASPEAIDAKGSSPEAQAEIEKAKAEANAMIEEIKAEAAEMQKQAVAAQKKTDAAAAATAKTKPAAEKK